MAEFTREGFEEVLGKRGIRWDRRDVWQGTFYRYDLGDPDRTIQDHLYVGEPHDISDRGMQIARGTAKARAKRARGIVMVRRPLPEADEFLFAELRPDHAIRTGGPTTHSHAKMRRGELEEHLDRDKVTVEDVVEGCTDKELEQYSRDDAWWVTQGADHGTLEDLPGKRVRHVHVSIVRYLFVKNQKKFTEPKHDHLDMSRTGLKDHLYQWHEFPRYAWAGGREAIDPVVQRILDSTPETGGVAIEEIERNVPPDDEVHPHAVFVDRTFYARRLSAHPLGYKRIKGAERVCIAMESLIKEAALVVVGEATMAAPSVTLWNAPELADVTRAHLDGKITLVIPDSDYDPAVRKPRRDGKPDDAVLRQAILFREALRRHGARAFIAAPQHPTRCTKGCKKHGADDAVAHGVTGEKGEVVDDFVWVDVEAPTEDDLTDWYEAHGVRAPSGRKLRGPDRIHRDAIVLRYLTYLALPHGGSTTISVTKLAGYCEPELEIKPRDVTVDRIERLPEELQPREFLLARHRAARQRVLNALHDMNEAKVVTGAGPGDLEHRVDYYLGQTEDWVGEIEIVPELQAGLRKDQTVADLMAQPRRWA
jgi:hypothetical protein